MSNAERPRQAPVKTRRIRAGQVFTLVLAGLAVLFAVLNLDEVKVNWIVGTWKTPLIVVIVVMLALGSGLGYFVAHRRGRARR
jgi:uncharacterized integral membrane protein